MKAILITVVLAVVLCLPGCSIVLPSHANLIADQAGNAAAYNAVIQADPTVSATRKAWWQAEADSWQYMAAWAHGEHPTPLPVK